MENLKDPDFSPALAKARGLILRHGWNATAYQILNPGMRLWFSTRGEAVAGFVQWGNIRVTAGAPVTEASGLADAVAEYERDAAAEGCTVCYFGAGARLEGLLGARRGYSRISLGAQPAWRPSRWDGILADRPSLRAQLHRARNKGVRVREWPASRVAKDPGIRLCLAQWLRGRGMPSMHFLVEPQTLDRIWDRRVFVAERAGKAVGFLVATPVPARAGWLIEQVVRGEDAPNGTAEALVDAAFHAAQLSDIGYFTLGLCPLSRTSGVTPPGDTPPGASPPGASPALPWWLDLCFRWMRAHGGRFYNFRGLEQFKSKFMPEEWEPIYAIVNRQVFPPRALLAVAAAFGGTSPIRFGAMALAKAFRQEGRWMWRRATADTPTTP